jgi:hypothetical protein
MSATFGAGPPVSWCHGRDLCVTSDRQLASMVAPMEGTASVIPPHSSAPIATSLLAPVSFCKPRGRRPGNLPRRCRGAGTTLPAPVSFCKHQDRRPDHLPRRCRCRSASASPGAAGPGRPGALHLASDRLPRRCRRRSVYPTTQVTPGPPARAGRAAGTRAKPSLHIAPAHVCNGPGNPGAAWNQRAPV